MPPAPRGLSWIALAQEIVKQFRQVDGYRRVARRKRTQGELDSRGGREREGNGRRVQRAQAVIEAEIVQRVAAFRDFAGEQVVGAVGGWRLCGIRGNGAQGGEDGWGVHGFIRVRVFRR